MHNQELWGKIARYPPKGLLLHQVEAAFEGLREKATLLLCFCHQPGQGFLRIEGRELRMIVWSLDAGSIGFQDWNKRKRRGA